MGVIRGKKIYIFPKTYFGFEAAKLNLCELALKPLFRDNNARVA